MDIKIQKNKPRRVAGKTNRDGHEVWRVTTNGQIKEIATRRSSRYAMDEAVVIYGRALQRLANR